MFINGTEAVEVTLDVTIPMICLAVKMRMKWNKCSSHLLVFAVVILQNL